MKLVESSWQANTISYNNSPSSYVEIARTAAVRMNNEQRYRFSFDVFEELERQNSDVYLYSDVFEFLSSGDLQGFCLTSDSLVSICSSEFSDASYRPTMTFEYSYTSPVGIINNGVYSFKNEASMKCLTVHNGGTANGTNVYQSTENGSRSQAFRLTYNEISESWLIRTMSSSDGYGSVLDFPYSSTINSSSGYVSQNVSIYQQSSSRADGQEWIIQRHSISLFKIVSRADPNLALTSYGTDDGTSGGTTSTSAGNVYVSQFTGSNNQLWGIETGGSLIPDGINIRDLPENILYNRYTTSANMYLICPVTEFGETVTWESSNPVAATVNEMGWVDFVQVGSTTITATVNHTDGTTSEYGCNIHVRLTDGVYDIYNSSGENTYYIYSTYNANEQLTSESFSLERYTQYKINYLGNELYSIRSMLDNSMGWSVEDGCLVLTDVGITNTSVPDEAKWKIQADVNGYYFVPYLSQNVSVSLSDGYSGNIVLTASSDTNSLQRLSLNKLPQTYTIGMDFGVYSSKIYAGETYTLKASMYSYSPNTHGGYSFYWSVDDTSIAVIDENGVITGINEGTVSVTVRMGTSPTITPWTASQKVDVELPIENGNYFVKNFGYSEYLQPNPSSSSSRCNLGDFQAAMYQRWEFEHLGGGYYKIISTSTGGALSVLAAQPGVENVPARIEEYVGGNHQKWLVKPINNGYTLSPLASPSFYLSFSEEYDFVCQYSAPENNSGEWIFEKAGEKVAVEMTCFIKNVNTNANISKYIQLNYNASTESITNDLCYVGAYTAETYQEWQIIHLENGIHKIISSKTGKALAVPLSGTNTNGTQIIQESYTGSDNKKWIIHRNDDGTYSIFAYSNPNYRLASDGNTLVQSTALAETRDEWNLYRVQYNVTLISFYDMGYCVRYNETESTSKQKIKEYTLSVSEQYLQLFGVLIEVNDIEYFYSDIDECKVTVTSENIDMTCNHSGIDHTNRGAVISDFSQTHIGNNTTVYVFWSGHILKNGEKQENRSCFHSNSKCIYMLEFSGDREIASEGVLMHELSHFFGAEDHYHEVTTEGNETSCKNKEICSVCGESPRPSSCIMAKSNQIINKDDILCNECKNDILLHLEELP